MTQLTFRGWQRPPIGATVTGLSGARPLSEVTVRLTARDAAGQGDAESAQLAVQLVGPGDIDGLRPGAIVRRFPSPHAPDAETTMCPYVDVVDPALPWRYTPEVTPPIGVRRLRPWLVLVVGTDEEIDAVGDRVTLAAPVRADYRLADSYRWAHVQEAGGVTLARVLSARRLVPDTGYIAALVPGYVVTNGALTDAWPAPGPDDGPLTVPAYTHWRFRTGPGGDFRTLANRLRPGAASASTGVAPVVYPRVPTAAPLAVRGALAPIDDPPGAPLDPDIVDDLAGLRGARRDDVGRPVVGLPRYGEAWHDRPGEHTWVRVLNRDPRHRGIAGIGLRLGVELQERLAAEAVRQAGALDNAAQRIRHLSAGLAASTSLWRRRLPADPDRRLWLFGPALRRVVTPAGPVDRLATAEDRPLAPGWFSTAARRATRPGPPRSALARPDAVDPARLGPAANTSPPAAPFSEAGLPLFDNLDGVDAAEFDTRRVLLARGAPPSRQAITGALGDLDQERFSARTRDRINTVRRLANERAADQPTPWVRLALALAALAAGEDDPVHDAAQTDAVLSDLVDRFDNVSDDDDVVRGLAADLGDEPEPAPPSRPVDLAGLADELTAAFDPTSDAAPARRRVVGAVDGLDPAEPLAPPEPCPGLDLPAWRELAAFAPDWLLPGVGQLDPDTVIALATNPVFVDAFMVGLNTRALEEFRWRNVRVSTGCTPLRGFWTRADTAAGTRVDDIVGVLAWAEESVLGDAQHRPAAVSASDLALVFCGQIFDRYPGTLLYLVTATHDGEVDFTIPPDPDAPRRLPAVQGRIGTDVRFFGFHRVDPAEVTTMWVVLEEPQTGGIRFRNDVRGADDARDGADFAVRAFDDPTRVLIQGDHLLPHGGRS